MEILYYGIALVVGAVLAGLVMRARYGAELRVLGERKAGLENECGEWKNQAAVAQGKVVSLTAELATATANLGNAEGRLRDFGKEVEQMQGRLKTEFENLANRVLEEKASRFTAQNQANLEQVLGPLREQIGEFKTKVEAVYTSDTADRAVLREQIVSLQRANAEVTEEARNLTQALKGDSKVQGDWGEMVLEKVLEGSGLTRGEGFTVQETLRGEDGGNLRPDVIIHLPEKRHFVVDSKVSLTAYERYCSEPDPEERKRALKEHVASMRKHVEELAVKRYQDLYQLSAPDFVFMFVPIEPAFSCALQGDRSWFNEAFERGVVLVTPSTLLATLRMVAHIWKHEKLARSTLEIARRAGTLYDKFVGLHEDLTEVGARLEAAVGLYKDALKKLKEGRGNLITNVEEIKRLGARAGKALPKELVEEAAESEVMGNGRREGGPERLKANR